MPVYLDHNASTPLRPEVFDAVVACMRNDFANASSVHTPGSRARCAVENARRAVALAIDVTPAEVVFTGGGTESNNLAIIGAVRASGLRRVLVSAVEHSSVLAAADALRGEGCAVERIPTGQDGVIDLQALESNLENGAALVSVGWANNEIGTLQPIDSVASVCARYGAVLHVDAVQAFGKVPLRVAGIDLLSLSAHKLGGPKGVGALLVRNGIGLTPLLRGGSQERGRRAGTENVAAIVGMGVACELAHAEVACFGEAAVSLRDRLWQGLQTHVGEVHRHGSPRGLPNTLNVRFDGVRGEALVASLDLAGIAVSSGSACAAGASEPSHVLLALGLGEDDARDGVRYSIGRTNTVDEIDHAIEATAAAVRRIRATHDRRRA